MTRPPLVDKVPDGRLAFRCGRIAIVGRPNVGKSTLVNALTGARISITSNKPQTTRHRVLGILTTSDAQFVFVDTPGFQTKHRSPLTERMNRTVRQSLADVDVVLAVLEAGTIDDADREVLALLPAGVPVVVALNKVDRVAEKRSLLPRIAELSALREFAAIVPISAEKRWQLDDLMHEIAQCLPAGDPHYPADEMTDRDERFLAGEYVREKIFRMVGAEVPYATAVTIDRFEHKGQLRRIHATVYVDKPSHRAILLGEHGERMKRIAAAARRDMEQMFGGKVFLEVWVKVESGWSSDERMLARFGY
ncbi:MAG TPA: GTPase Era [Casimicrobiaceae bacterium]|nr:GTPase Era [Casimicrobiaceae bacterium]